MDQGKREFLRTSLLGAIASVAPVNIMEAVAAEGTATPKDLTDVYDALNSPGAGKKAPLIINEKQAGPVLIKKEAGLLKAYKIPDTAPPDPNIKLQPLDSGEYDFGSAGKFTVNSGVVKKSSVNPNALTIKWSEHADIKIDAMQGQKDFSKIGKMKSSMKSGAYTMSSK